MATQFIRRERGPNHPPTASRAYQCTANSVRYGVSVREIAGGDRPTFQATAYLVDRTGHRAAVVNENGRPLVGIGTTAVKATSYLLSALRRRTS
jgi:hypothetical protein